MTLHTYLTTQDVRDFLMDRSLDDNELGGDLEYDDEEIEQAMRRAAREYNSIPPLGVGSVHAQNLPSHDNILLEAVAEQLCRTTIHRLRRQDLDYTAGGVGVNLVAKRIEHLRIQIDEHRQAWEPRAREKKLTINNNLAFRTFN